MKRILIMTVVAVALSCGDDGDGEGGRGPLPREVVGLGQAPAGPNGLGRAPGTSADGSEDPCDDACAKLASCGLIEPTERAECRVECSREADPRVVTCIVESPCGSLFDCG